MTRRHAPWFLLIPGLLAVIFLVLPVIGLVTQAPWGSFGTLLSDPVTRDALRISAVSSLVATAICIVLGTPLAWLLARNALPGTRFIRALVVVPLLLPPVVAGVSLLTAFGRRGFAGSFLYDNFGIQFPFTTTGVVLAEAFVAMPFLIITVEAGFRGMRKEYEEVAATLGASSWQTFRHVTLPLVAPALLSGVVLCWARAVGEFGATIGFAGNFPGVTQTMPLAIYSQLEIDRSLAIGLSTILLIVCLVILVLLRRTYLRGDTAND
jgi:molybdate transport system permease protein